MKQYDKDGDYIDPTTGLAGLLMTEENAASRKRIISIPESSRDEMFELTKKEFLQGNGMGDGDTTKRSVVYTAGLELSIKDETSSLKGNLNDDKDVDFYNFSIPFMSTQRNYFGVEVYIDMPEGCDYDLTLYDEYGSQVGKAEWDGEGRKKLTVPNWDINTNKCCLKVEIGNGEEASPDDYYKISFRVSENKEHEKTDAIRESYGTLHNAYSRKDENWREYPDQYNAVLRETEQNYIKELEQFHQKQFDSLP